MLGGFLFILWRIAEIVTLIPVIGMLVSTSSSQSAVDLSD